MARLHGVLLVVFLVLLPLYAPAGERPAPTTAEIDRLIRHLGSERFRERETASKALLAIGEPALGPLQKAEASSKDAEVRQRARQLVTAIEDRLARQIRQAGCSDEERVLRARKFANTGTNLEQKFRRATKFIQVGMGMDQVRLMLGEPGSCGSLNVSGWAFYSEFDLVVQFSYNQFGEVATGKVAGFSRPKK